MAWFGWQQSQTSSSTISRATTAPERSSSATRKLVPSNASGSSNDHSASWRPSSQNAAILPSHANSSTKPCSAAALSSFNCTGAVQLRPPSADTAVATW